MESILAGPKLTAIVVTSSQETGQTYYDEKALSAREQI
jgi:hypothetical protein